MERQGNRVLFRQDDSTTAANILGDEGSSSANQWLFAGRMQPLRPWPIQRTGLRQNAPCPHSAREGSCRWTNTTDEMRLAEGERG